MQTQRPNIPLRFGGSLLAVLGAWGVLTALPGFSKLWSSRAVASFVFANDQRLPPVEAIEQLRSALLGNSLTILTLAISLVAVGLILFSLIQAASARAPLQALMSGVFLAGSILSGFVFGLIALKVNELAIQSGSASPAEEAWLKNGIVYLNQAHLVFVYAWFLFMGLAWFFLGLAAPPTPMWARASSRALSVAGVAVVVSVAARFWLPSYGATVPEAFLFLASDLAEVGLALGLLACGLLTWQVGGEVPSFADRTEPATVFERR